MLTIRQASETDCPLIRRMAEEAFPATYREILTPAQLDYMMEWMYSDASLREQFRAGHVWFIASFLFRHAVEYIRSVQPAPCLMELNVNRRNPALHFYERMGMRRLREGDFPIGGGYYMNDYIMGLEIR